MIAYLTSVLNPMANIATLLKDEITRISRKEIRKEVLSLKKASNTQRHAIATLKRELQDLQRSIGTLAKRSAAKREDVAFVPTRPLRFVAKGLVALRGRLGVSAAEMGQLLSVSAQTIYNWEQKKTTPGKQQVLAIAEMRLLGKREARKRLDAAAE